MKYTREELIKALNSQDESQRLYAVEDILDSSYIDLAVNLVERLKVETSPMVKNSIISVLQKMNCVEAYQKIFEFFSSEDPFLRNSAVGLFSKYGEEGLNFLVSYIDYADKEVRKLILDALVEMALLSPELKTQVLDVFHASLHDPAINVVITAVEYITKLEDKASLEELAELYTNVNEPMLKVAILDFFLKIGELKDLKLAYELLFHKGELESIYLSQAIRICGKLANKDKFLELLNSLEDWSYYSEDILFALDSLNKTVGLEDTVFFDIIKKISEQKNLKEDLKFTCVKLLLSFPTKENIEFIKNWAKKESIEFQEFCKEAIYE
jgi:HEAT repeat protein